MEIYIEGKQVHINNTGVELDFVNIRFSEAVADEWSTEIELPNDSWNISILEAYGLLDRGAIFNHKIICAVQLDSISRDGYLQVLSIDEHTIKVRVYLLSIPYEILDKKVSDYYPHNDVVFRWDRFSPITTNIAGVDVGIIPYDYTATDFYSNIIAQWHSSVSVMKIIDNIQTAENITLPAVNNTLYELSSRKKVCPSNRFQVFQIMKEFSSQTNEMPLEMAGGQHITNDFSSSWSYADFKWNASFSNWDYQLTNFRWLENCEKKDRITFNRDCTAHIKIYAVATDGGASIQPKLNNAQLRPWRFVPNFNTSSWTLNDIKLYDFTTTFQKDDVFELKFWGEDPLDENRMLISIVVEYTDYEWDENDYDVDLVYVPAPFLIWYAWSSGGVTTYDNIHDFTGTGDGTHSAADYSFTYFGAYSNLERDLSVREYLTSLCWVHNQKLKLDKNELIFQSANQKKEITANITQIEPFTDKLGQNNKIGYSGLEECTEFQLDNEFLENEIVIHENSFFSADIIPQYEYEMTYSEKANSDGEHWVTDINVKFEEVGVVVMNAVDYGNRYTLEKCPDIIGFGLKDLNSAMVITAETMDNITDIDYVFINGHKYMVIQGSTDLNTFITEFTAIQCYTSGVEYEPSMEVFITGSDQLTSSSVRLQIRINES